MIVQAQASGVGPTARFNLASASAPRSAPAGVEMLQDTFEVHVTMPRIVDPRHPEGSEALNTRIREKFAQAEADAQPLPGCSGSLDGGVTKTYDDGHLLALSLSFDSYSGGAHPNTRLETVLYDSDRGRAAGLEDLFADKAGYLETLSRGVSDALARQPDMEEGCISTCSAPYASNLASFQPTAEGLLFALPAERTGPIGAGMFDATVPWERLRPSLDPHGPLWRESQPFKWTGANDPRREVFGRLVGMYGSDGALATGQDPKSAALASNAVEDYLAVTGAAASGDLDLAALTDEFVSLHEALGRFGQAEATAASFGFIEDGLQNGDFGQATREQVTARFVEGFLMSGDVARARNHALVPSEGPVGGVDMERDSVVIGGVRVPIHQG